MIIRFFINCFFFCIQIKVNHCGDERDNKVTKRYDWSEMVFWHFYININKKKAFLHFIMLSNEGNTLRFVNIILPINAIVKDKISHWPFSERVVELFFLILRKWRIIWFKKNWYFTVYIFCNKNLRILTKLKIPGVYLKTRNIKAN